MNRRQFLRRGAMAAVAVSVAPAAVLAVAEKGLHFTDLPNSAIPIYGDWMPDAPPTESAIEEYEDNDYWEVWSKTPNFLSMTRVYCDETGGATLPTYLWGASSRDELNYRYVSREEASEQKRQFYENHWPILKGGIRDT